MSAHEKLIGALMRFHGMTRQEAEERARELEKTRRNPAKRTRAKNPLINRPSQITKKKPSARLKARRVKNLKMPKGVFPNPRTRGDIDEVYAQEIFLFGTNDGDLYRQRTTYMIDNLAKKYAAGKYDRVAALKLWKVWADEAAKRYAKEYVPDARGYVVNVPTRQLIAEKAEDYYLEHVKQESTKFLKPKKNPVRSGLVSRPRKGKFSAMYRVEKSTDGKKWKNEGIFPTEKSAREYAEALDRRDGGKYWLRVTV